MNVPLPALDCWFISGPTASGKTDVGLELARLVDGEIISLDSMAVYRRLDIGTAKPIPEQRRQVPHHLLDVVDPGEEFTLARYVDLARQAIARIRGRSREPIFVGGTPLYLKTLLRGMFEGPEADWEFRRQIAGEVETAGHQALHERLVQVDPVTAAKLHPHDTRRLIRALEVYKLTGQPISHLQMQFDQRIAPHEGKVFVLSHPRPRLHERIDQRVEWMFQSGFVEEVRGLLDEGRELGRTAGQAVGYREVLDHLDGRFSLEETIERVKARTRRFARRQETWFRSLGECRIISVDEDSPESVARRIEQAGSA
ncbi:MAG: tRNA (adenosine(37)-N6)-dimethylallyltransferase MiaA [Pirellulales bacterium]